MLSVRDEILKTNNKKDFFSLKYFWNAADTDVRNHVLNNSNVIDELSADFNELADRIEEYHKLPFNDLPKELRKELSHFGVSFKKVKKSFANCIDIRGKRDLIKILKRPEFQRV